MTEKTRIATLQQLKAQAEKIVMVTAYDYPTGRLADEAGVDVVLVGDSLGNAVLGFDDTIPVTIEHMVHHTAAVRRGVERALLVTDMPFMTYKISPEQALHNAARLVQEGGAEAVKLEGGKEVCEAVRRLVEVGIPVMGHLGVTPQSVHSLSGYHVRGTQAEEADRLMDGAHALEEAGCFAIVLEVMPWDLAARVTAALRVPTIGIGAGADCDGQVLVTNDLIGLSFGESPRFVKTYGQVGQTIRSAFEAFSTEVRGGSYPDRQHAYSSEPRKRNRE